MAYPRDVMEVDRSMGTIPEGMGALMGSINELVICTYNESHIVSGGRYHGHIENCRKAYKDRRHVTDDQCQMQICPYNSGHHVHARAMYMHIQICEGFYQWNREHQAEPPSMKVDYPRYNTVTVDPNPTDGGEEEEEEEEVVRARYEDMEEYGQTAADDRFARGYFVHAMLPNLPNTSKKTRLKEICDFVQNQRSTRLECSKDGLWPYVDFPDGHDHEYASYQFQKGFEQNAETDDRFVNDFYKTEN